MSVAITSIGQPNLAVSDFAFIRGHQSACVVGESGTILHTTDGGDTWTRQAVPTSNSLKALSVVDTNTATIVGDNGVILRTNTGGE